jgi:diguanylate cyclase (GGDEF)-like protein/PAS domain S-box-containing protein
LLGKAEQHNYKRTAMKINKYFHFTSSVALPLLTLLILLSITYSLFNIAKVELEQKTQTYFDFRVREAVNLINNHMHIYEQVLHGTSGLFIASDHVDRNEFKQYIATLNLAKNHADIKALGFSLIVPSAKKTQHIASIRNDGLPNYIIWPEGQRDIYNPIIYLEPYSNSNLRTFGYDMFTEPVLNDAMQKATDTGRPQLSRKIKLLQDPNKQDQAGFMMYLPIYRNGTSNDTSSERRQHILGWVYSPFGMNDFMKGLFGEHANDLSIHIFDGESMASEDMIYRVDNLHHATINEFEITQSLELVGHTWTVQIRPLPSMSSRINAIPPNLVASIGVMISVLLTLFIWFLVMGRERAITATSDIRNERQRLSSIIEGTRSGTWEWNVQTGELIINEYWANIIDYELSELEPISIETWIKFVHPEDAKLSGDLLEKHFSGELAYYECEVRMRHKNGYWVWVLERGKVTTWTPDGKPLLMFGTHQEITKRKQAEDELRIAATAFESQEGVFVTDVNNVILRVNQSFTTITGYSAEEAVGQTPKLLSSGRQDKTFYITMWESLIKTGAWEGKIWNRRKNGEVYPEHLVITAVKDATNIVTHYVASLTDITMSQIAADKIKKLAFYDPLTQLPNRRLLLDRLNQALATSRRRGKQGAILFLDLDHFKILNDTLGHDVGDMLLQQVATRLTACVREGDTVARLGGDEFVVLLEELSEQNFETATQVQDVAEKIILSLNRPYQFNTHTHHSTSSIGATVFSGNEETSGELLKQADIAMYHSKDAGRNTLRFFDPAMQEAITIRADMEKELGKAIKHHQFQLYYQIQLSHTGQALGAEALIRWQHPERGMISPFDFIPLAEETGLILPIGQWVLETACAQLKAWSNNPLTQELIIAVNVSAKQFHQEDFVEQLLATITRHDINPTRLKLELTESMLVDNINEIITKMDTLSKIGIRFSLDDFGTGYSSLQYLKKLPLNQLKIDQSFVRDITSDSSDKAIVRTIITMAHSLDINVIAEGVETAEQRRFLLDNGCKYYQGYLFSKPVPIDQFEALLGKADF